MPEPLAHAPMAVPAALDGAILRSTDTSPFGRKVRVALAMLGWLEAVEVVPGSPVDPIGALVRDNPLGKMPCLVLADGMALYDSPVILDYLDGLSGGGLVPAPFERRIAALREQALADGLTDAAMLIGSERMFHDAAQVSDRWVAHQRAKVERALRVFETAPPSLDPVEIGAISLATALGYLDWRQPLDWRALCPGLVAWLDAFDAAVPAYAETRAAT